MNEIIAKAFKWHVLMEIPSLDVDVLMTTTEAKKLVDELHRAISDAEANDKESKKSLPPLNLDGAEKC